MLFLTHLGYIYNVRVADISTAANLYHYCYPAGTLSERPGGQGRRYTDHFAVIRRIFFGKLILRAAGYIIYHMTDNVFVNGNAYEKSGGLTGNMLKLIAIVAMFLDHYAHLFLVPGSAEYTICRAIGRTTGPVMFYLLAEGYRHTHNVNRYMLRLSIFAIISYLPYFLMTKQALPTPGTFASFDVIYTLFLGLVALRALHEIKNALLKYIIIAAVFFLSVPADWYYLGIIMILAFDYFYGDFKKQAFAYFLVIALNLMPIISPAIRYIFTGQDFNIVTITENLYRFGLFIPLVLLSKYNGRRGVKNFWSKWGFYIFYPAHIMALVIVYYFTVMV